MGGIKLDDHGFGHAVDLLGGPVHRRGAGGHLPRGGDQGHPLQEPRLVNSISHGMEWMESCRSSTIVCADRCSCNYRSAVLFLSERVCVSFSECVSVTSVVSALLHRTHPKCVNFGTCGSLSFVSKMRV